MTPERDGDRAATRSAVLNPDSLSHQRTAMARLEAASSYLAAGLLGHSGDLALASVNAITLIDASLRDLKVVTS
jgi:hypothetical protein